MVCAAPWAFGAVEPLYWAPACAACFAATIPALVGGAFSEGGSSPLPRRTLAIAAAVPLAALVGLVPIPPGLRALIAPRSAEILAAADPAGADAWRPISLDPRATLGAAIVAAAAALVFWAVARGAARRGVASAVTVIVLLNGAGLAAFGLVYRLWDYDMTAIYWTVRLSDVSSPFGPYVNRNHFAGAMLPILGIAAGACAAAGASGRRAACAIAGGVAGLAAVALAATTSRGAIVGAAGGVAVFVVATRGAARRRLLAVVVAGVAVVVAGLLATGLLGDLAARIHPDLRGREWNRVLVQLDALRVFLGAPLFGTGAGTFEAVYPPFQTVPDDRYFRNAHSDWAQLLMETGLVGAAVAIAAARDLIGRTRQAIRSEGAERWLVIGPAAGAVALAVHGFFEPNLRVPANGFLFAATVGLACGAAARLTGPPRDRA